MVVSDQSAVKHPQRCDYKENSDALTMSHCFTAPVQRYLRKCTISMKNSECNCTQSCQTWHILQHRSEHSLQKQHTTCLKKRRETACYVWKTISHHGTFLLSLSLRQWKKELLCYHFHKKPMLKYWLKFSKKKKNMKRTKSESGKKPLRQTKKKKNVSCCISFPWKSTCSSNNILLLVWLQGKCYQPVC